MGNTNFVEVEENKFSEHLLELPINEGTINLLYDLKDKYKIDYFNFRLSSRLATNLRIERGKCEQVPQ